MVKHLAKSIYNKEITPCCGYCANAQLSPSLKLIFCRHKGPVSELDVCRRYCYDPFKRAPKTAATLPDFSEEDFSL